MRDAAPASIAFLGFGLIGGSIARALARNATGSSAWRRPHLRAWTPGGSGPAQAVRDGIIDLAAGSPADAIENADLVVLAAPPVEAIGLVRRLGADLAPHLSSSCVVTDVTSTKSAIMAAAATAGLRFVGGHPMAGRESSGYAAGSADLFVDRPWVLVLPPGASGDDAEPVRWLVRHCGAGVVEMTPEAHDAATAAISHLPLLTAAALVEVASAGGDEARADAMALAASGWASATRLARGDPRMGAGIVATNAPAVARQVRRLRDVLDSWLQALESEGGPDPVRLERRLRAARAILDADDRPTG